MRGLERTYGIPPTPRKEITQGDLKGVQEDYTRLWQFWNSQFQEAAQKGGVLNKSIQGSAPRKKNTEAKIQSLEKQKLDLEAEQDALRREKPSGAALLHQPGNIQAKTTRN